MQQVILLITAAAIVFGLTTAEESGTLQATVGDALAHARSVLRSSHTSRLDKRQSSVGCTYEGLKDIFDGYDGDCIAFFY